VEEPAYLEDDYCNRLLPAGNNVGVLVSTRATSFCP